MVNPLQCTCQRRWRDDTTDIVGVDISGRHAEDGEYLMVAAAVQAAVDATRIHAVGGIGFATSRREPTLAATTGVVADAADALPEPPNGPFVAEAGEFYEEPAWRVAQALEGDFKYVETISEREVVETAHHAAYAARTLVR